MQDSRRASAATATLVALFALSIPVGDARADTLAAEESASVASVNGEAITLDEYLDALAEMHAAVEDGGPMIERKDPTALLERLINLKLVLQEARSIGLDELPEFESSVAGFRAAALRSAILAHAASQAPPVDPQEVERVYRRMLEEVEISAVLFEQGSGAEAFAAALAAGGDFAEVGRRLLAEGQALRFEPPRYLLRSELLPPMVTALEQLQTGQTSQPIDIGQGFVVFEVTGRRVPENEEARAAARSEVVSTGRSRAISDYLVRQRDARAQFDDELIATLDLDSEAASFEERLRDERVVARFDEGEPIRVRDVAAAVRKRLYHGVEQASKKKRLDRLKGSAIEELTNDRLIRDEARRLKLDETDEFQAQIDEYRNALLFGMFVGKVVAPSIKVTPDEARGYYDRHVADYTQPEMVRLESLIFAEAPAAQHALERLRAGADMQWMRSNAEGQVDAQAIPPEAMFDNRILMVSSLPQVVREALVGAEAGDVRLCTEGAERHHVLVVRERFAGTPRAFEAVHEEVQQRAYAEKQATILDDWTRRLREASEIRILVQGEQLRELARQGMGRLAQ